MYAPNTRGKPSNFLSAGAAKFEKADAKRLKKSAAYPPILAGGLGADAHTH
jgi:hypothetical protein